MHFSVLRTSPYLPLGGRERGRGRRISDCSWDHTVSRETEGWGGISPR